MYCQLYIRNGIAYVPITAKTEAGYYMNVDPVEVVPVSDTESFARAVDRVIAHGHPIVPTPTRASGFPKPVVPKYAKLGSWRAFEKGATSWKLVEKDGVYTIEQWQKREQGGWLPDPDRDEQLPQGASLDDAVRRLVERIQESVGNQ